MNDQTQQQEVQRRAIREGSLTQQLINLEVDEVHAVVKRLDLETMWTEEAVSKAKHNLSTTVSKAARRLIERTDSTMEFEVETSTVITARNRPYIICIATRLR
jgi:hypothetical protein